MANIQPKKEKITKLTVRYVAVTKLVPYINNARTHSDHQVTEIMSSIKEFGFTNPVLIDETNVIIAGHGRLMAAMRLNLTSVPTITLKGLTPTQRKAYIIADNKLALNAGWDVELLTLELTELKEMDYNLDLIGFNDKELDKLFADTIKPGLVDDDEIPNTVKAITKVGDIWQLDNHRILCGDSTDPEQLKLLFNGVIPDLVFTDPPYGISAVKPTKEIGGGATAKFGNSKKKKNTTNKIIKTNTYKDVAGDDSTDTTKAFFDACQACKLTNFVIWGGNYFTDFLPPSRCWIVWDKENTGDFADFEMAWTNYKTSARLYKWLWNGLSRKGDRKTEGLKRMHPTQKPVGLFVDIFKDFAGKLIFDGFVGSGSTLIACEKTDRNCYAIEIDPFYVDLCVKRWEMFTGKKAINLNA